MTKSHPLTCINWHVAKMSQVSCHKLNTPIRYMSHDKCLKHDTCAMLIEATKGSA